jgi:hypothetical protein
MPTTIGTFLPYWFLVKIVNSFYWAMSLGKDYTFTWFYNTLTLDVVWITSGQK